MCMRTTCNQCGKYTWVGKLKASSPIIFFLLTVHIGCGKHIEQALAGLKDEEICKCKK